MHLLVDVGNTRAKWALIESDMHEDFLACYGSIKELAGYIHTLDTASTHVLLAAVNQTEELLSIFENANFQSFKVVKTKEEQAGIKNSYDQPGRMGVDRWLAMIESYRKQSLYDYGGTIVVDAGSAMTVDVLNREGVHQGGYIVPGFTMAQSALFSNTEKVKRYDEEVNADTSFDDLLNLGRNTAQCVEYGIIVQMVSLVRSVVGKYDGYKLIITGGDGELLARFFDDPLVDKNLVLKGLWQVRN